METWTDESLKEQIWCYRILCWAILIIYFFPTVFMIMAGFAVWQMVLWGLTASAGAVWFYEDKYKEINKILESRSETK